MRRGVGIWQAIMVLLMMSGMLMVILKYSAVSTRHTVDTYVREQAELYLQSAIEQTLLAISAHDRSSGGCLSSYTPNPVTVRATTYRARVDIVRYYLLNGSDDYNACGGATNPIVTAIQTEESHGMVMLHVEVTATVDGENRVRLLRRSLQHP